MSVKLEKMEIPEFKQRKDYNNNYYVPGADGKWFDNLMYLYDNCSTHAAIINNLKRRICKDLEKDKVFEKAVLDYLITGCMSLQVKWNINHTKIVDIVHLDASKVMIGMINKDTDEPSLYYYSNDWQKYNNRKVDIFYPFSEDKGSDDNQLFYYKRYCPNGSEWSVYRKPDYYSSIKSIYTKIQIDSYYANLVKNNFVANCLVSVPSFNDEQKEKAFEKSLNDFTGSDNAGSMMVIYTDGENKPEIIKFNGEKDDEKYSKLNEDVINEIFMGHNLPPALGGVMYSGKLGNATELPQYEELYDTYVVNPIKDELLAEFDKLNKYMPVKKETVAQPLAQPENNA